MVRSDNSTRIPGMLLVLFCVAWNLAWLDPLRDNVSDGNRAWKEKKYDEADRKYGEAEPHASSDKDKSRLAFNRGDALYGKGDYEGALRYYDEAVKSPETDTRTAAQYNRGNALAKLNRYPEALKAYRDTLKTNPDHEKARMNIESLLNMNKQDKQQQNNSDGKNNSEKDKSQQSGEKNGQKSLTPEQAKNLLETMKNKPVRQQRGKGNGQRSLEKNW